MRKCSETTATSCASAVKPPQLHAQVEENPRNFMLNRGLFVVGRAAAVRRLPLRDFMRGVGPLGAHDQPHDQR